MTDWKALAAAADPPVPEEILDQVIPPLEALEAAFRPLLDGLSPDAQTWSGALLERASAREKAEDAE